jgi:hypothetical protein
LPVNQIRQISRATEQHLTTTTVQKRKKHNNLSYLIEWIPSLCGVGGFRARGTSDEGFAVYPLDLLLAEKHCRPQSKQKIASTDERTDRNTFLWRNQYAVERSKNRTICFSHHQKMNAAALYFVRPRCRNGRETAVCLAAVPSVVIRKTMPTWFAPTDYQLCVCNDRLATKPSTVSPW